MTKKILFLTALMAFPLFGTVSEANARDKDEEYCREYTKTVNIGGRSERAYGTACYKPDGSWEIVRLEGSDEGQNRVRDDIYDDIEKSTSYRGESRSRIIVVENYHSPDRYRYYKRSLPHNRFKQHYSTVSLGFPFGVSVGNGYHHSYNHGRYKSYNSKKSYKHNKHYKNARYDKDRHYKRSRNHR